MATHITGVEGQVSSEAQVVMGIDHWSADLSADSIETTDFDDAGWKTRIAGNRECVGTFEGNWDTDDDISADPPNLNEGQIVTLKLEIQDTTLPLQYLSFDALIQNVNIDVTQADKVRFTVSFESTGEVTRVFATP